MTDPALHNEPTTAPRSEKPAFGLQYIRNGVAFYFEQKHIPATVAEVGFKYRSFALNQGPNGANRICFIPGELTDPSTPAKARKAGKLSRSGRNSGSAFNPREIASWESVFTVSVWAGPVAGANNSEGENLAQAVSLLELVLRAFGNTTGPDGKSIGASIHYDEILVNSPPTDNAFGAELLVKMIQIVPFFDEAYEVVQAKVNASNTLT